MLFLPVLGLVVYWIVRGSHSGGGEIPHPPSTDPLPGTVAELDRWRSAGLVTDDRHGRERRIRGNPEAIRRAQTLLDGFERLWRGRIDRLDALLADD